MQPGVSNPRSGPHGGWDTAHWSQRVFPPLPRVRLHHHTARRHVRETLLTHTRMSLHSSICIYRYCSYLQSKLLPSGSITAMMYLRHELLSPDLYGKKIEQAGQKLGGLSWHLSKKRAQTEMKQLHIVPKNNSSCKCHGGGGHFEPGCLKCIESAREESICPRCSKTWDYCLTFSCCYCRQALNNGSPNAYKTNVCHTSQKEFTSDMGFILQIPLGDSELGPSFKFSR